MEILHQRKHEWLCLFKTLCCYIAVADTPYAQSHLFLTLWDCVKLWVKSSLCPASSGDIKRCCLADFGGPEPVGLEQE